MGSVGIVHSHLMYDLPEANNAIPEVVPTVWLAAEPMLDSVVELSADAGLTDVGLEQPALGDRFGELGFG